MIIECPACTTKYDIKAQLPPGGRSVRCAKCGAIWRIKPEAVNGPAAAAAGAGPDANETVATNALAGPGIAGGGENEHAAPRAQAGGGHGDDRSDVAGDSFGTAAFNGVQREQQAGNEEFPDPGHPPGFLNDGLSGWPVQREGHDKEDGTAESRDTGKVRWFGFRRKNGAKPDSEGETGFDRPAAASSAETIPFPRANPAAVLLSQEPSALESLDQARAAVRSVFDSLGDQRPAGRNFNAPVVSQAEQEQSGTEYAEPGGYRSAEDEPAEHEWPNAREPAGPAPRGTGWEPDALAKHGFEAGLEQSRAGDGDPQEEEAPGKWQRGWETDEDDPDAQLRSALRAHFPARDQEDGGAPAGSQFGQPDAEGELEGSESEEAEAAWAPPPGLLRKQPEGRPPEPEDAFGETSEGDGSFDQRLFREISETREQGSQRRRSHGAGGLALAAAWGLFLCVAGGLIAGFIGFRDITAGALPGLAPLYRALGMPATDQPLIFEGVQYEWIAPENKPALNIKGAVYNRARRGVKVPDFVITIKDGDPAFDREYSAKLQVNGSQIRPEERADFEIELLLPSPSITAVELELRSVR